MENTKPTIINDTLGSVTNFFTVIYGMILTLSMSYNIGYFKYINPQIVDLMSLGDYVDDTIHNLWLFLFATLLFFCSSLVYYKERIRDGLSNLIIFGLFALVSSIYFLLKGMHHSKFWPTVKILLVHPSSALRFGAVLIIALILIIFLIYKLLFKAMQQGDPPGYLVSIIPVVIFLTVILTPYLGGVIQGYIESQYLTRDDYKIQSVDLVFIPDGYKLKNVFIVRKLGSGLVIRQFIEGNAADKFSFINWANIKEIRYKNVVDY